MRAWPLAAGLAGLLLLRIVLMLGSGASLHVDEAQYWDWSREWHWGYFSKPPGVALLIATSTALFGDGELGVRLLAMMCWPLTAGVLFVLGRSMSGQTRVGAWAAALFITSPLAALLGQVATTDSVLMFAWALALLGLWRATQEAWTPGWWLFGLALGLGLLDKYTMAALVPGAIGWAWRCGQLPRALLAMAGGGLMFAPHLLWNAQAGWPTLRHTAEITVQSGQALPISIGGALGYVVAQVALLAPIVLVGLLIQRPRARLPLPALSFLAALHAPLLAAGVFQAAKGHAELNWVAPLHLAGHLAMAAWAAGAWPRWQGAWRPLALQLFVVSLLAGGWTLVAPAQLPEGLARLDVWARMRGWREALTEVAQQLQRREPRALVIAQGRTLAAQMAYHWRDRPLDFAILGTVGKPPANHYQSRCPWHPGLAAGRAVFLLSDEALDEGLAQSLGGLSRVAEFRAPRLGGQASVLTLWRLDAPAAGSLPTRASGACP